MTPSLESKAKGTDNKPSSFKQLIREVLSCNVCASVLPHSPRPILQLNPHAKILIAGQAPGRVVHESGIPFDDASGDRLRGWMGVDKNIFYDNSKIAILPMAFCYPGKGKSGDLPPRPECAIKWRKQLLEYLPKIQLTLIIGQYANQWYFGNKGKITLTKAVRDWEKYWPEFIILPHPSPRNNIWLKKNNWFEENNVPRLKRKIGQVLSI